MKKRILSLMMASTMVISAMFASGCGKQNKISESTAATTTVAEKTTAAQEENEPQEENESQKELEAGSTIEDATGSADSDVITGGSPWLNTDLQENVLSMETFSPKDDFHAYVNHEWLAQQTLKDGYSSYGSGNEVQDITKEETIKTIKDESLTSHDAILVRELYNGFLDWNARNKVGLEPLKGILDDIKTINSTEDLNSFYTDIDRSILASHLIFQGCTTDIVDPTRYVTGIVTPGLTFKDAAEYKKQGTVTKLTEEAYRIFMSKVLTRIGYTDDEITKICDDTFAFESKIAEVSMTSADKLSPDYLSKILNYYTLDELKSLFSNIPIDEFIKAYGYEKSNTYIVPEPKVCEKVSELYVDENIEQIKNYLIFHTVNKMSGMLDKETYDNSYEIVNHILGSTGSEPYEERAYNAVKSSLSDPLQVMYLEKHDVSKMKDDITTICRDVIDAYREMLNDVDWLTDETKEKALGKIDTMSIHVVEPEKFHDYSGLDFTDMSYVEMQKALIKYDIKLDKECINQNVDYDYWLMSTLESNAYYYASNNSINILLGILGGNFYNENMTKEEMYGGIGAIIGHEISHAFDTVGAQFDKDGKFVDWWTEEDYTAFKNRTQKLIDYYNNIVVFGDVKVPGDNVQTEAIADIAGVKVMLSMAAKEEDFDYDKFFTAYAKNWRCINTYSNDYLFLTQDEHPLNYLRTNVVVQQFDEFMNTYDIKEGDNMYLAPENRISVW